MSEEIEEHAVVVTSASCQVCGKCCISNNPRWVPLYAADAAAIEQHIPDGSKFIVADIGTSFPAFMRMVDGKCAALHKNVHGLLQCLVYEHRPKACRDYVAGDEDCLEERDWTYDLLSHKYLWKKETRDE